MQKKYDVSTAMEVTTDTSHFDRSWFKEDALDPCDTTYTWRLRVPAPMFLHHPTTSTGMWSLSLFITCMITPISFGLPHDLPSIRNSQLYHVPPVLFLAHTRAGSCPT